MANVPLEKISSARISKSPQMEWLLWGSTMANKLNSTTIPTNKSYTRRIVSRTTLSGSRSWLDLERFLVFFLL